MAPRYVLTDRFELEMLSSLTADITLTEISLDQVCELIEKAELEKKMGLHGGWADGIRTRTPVELTPHGPILLVAQTTETERGAMMKWVQVEIID
ncbi:MAG: hypothetical protein KKF85_16320 [Gammaproteobacteria bacterium]|nr:hypothetical protein [Rhodocyclaceae bacterium]MBU3908914.1 hypothetical protein [Gammaproteobacteria bacterium]MBU4021548.1 hypothetical protein [Gammaproteobacteria bacterium]MBU4095009.1 hypothetical protein [Gammaproteobacteria bacterium]MBU4148525.1 hypothetical protein [Gammaproteobacteria bacterium]